MHLNDEQFNKWNKNLPHLEGNWAGLGHPVADHEVFHVQLRNHILRQEDDSHGQLF